MKRANSLEEERQALLEQIHSSRAAYRRMLAQYDAPEDSAGSAAYGADSRLDSKPHVSGMPGAFPRSMTMRWIIGHPWAIAGAVAGVVALAAVGPRRIKRGVAAVPAVAAIRKRMHNGEPEGFGSWSRPERRRPREVVVEKSSPAGGALMASAMGLVTMMLRDPARMRMAARTAAQAWNWFNQRRQHQNGRMQQGRSWNQVR